MTIRIGRITLARVERVNVTRTQSPEAGILGPRWAREYQVTGTETLLPQVLMDGFEAEAKREFDVYVTETGGALPTGYYRIVGSPSYSQEGGGVAFRRWRVTLQERHHPNMIREAENTNVAGSEINDKDANLGRVITYTPTASYVEVLDIGNQGEPLDLPEGDYQVLARVQATTTSTAEVRAVLKDSNDAALTTGTDTGFTNADEWEVLDLGTFTVPAANHEANTISIDVRDSTNTNAVLLDHVRIVSTANVLHTVATPGQVDELETQGGVLITTQSGDQLYVATR